VVPDRAEQTAQAYGIPRVYATIDELLHNPAVDIVDIAVRPCDLLPIVEQVTAVGKHLLCQKPLAGHYRIARQIVNLASEVKVNLAVNQQMRWNASRASLADTPYGRPCVQNGIATVAYRAG
jgi:predicted dehydrogenase